MAERLRGEDVPLSDERRREILADAEALADRCTAGACRWPAGRWSRASRCEAEPDSAERELVHVGLVGHDRPAARGGEDGGRAAAAPPASGR